MPELTQSQAINRVVDLGDELDKRATRHRLLELYRTGDCPLPVAIQKARITKAYRMLMAFAGTNYGSVCIKAASSRLQIGGIRSGNKDVDDALWQIWQDNHMDAESRRGIDGALTHGRVFALIWPSEDGGSPSITLEDASTVIVEYREGSRYERTAALRRWIDGDRAHATLYTPDFTYKFSGPKHSSGSRGTQWEPRLVEDEAWPLATPGQIVPVVEIGTNKRMKAGRFGYASGDFESSIGLLDRINVLEFLRLVMAFTSSFPIRAVIGDEIQKDDGKVIAPFELAADIIAQFENPNVKLAELAAGDVKGFGEALNRDIEAFAGITQTPAYYLRSVPIQNVSADAIRASDSPLNARVEGHKPDLSEGVEDTIRTAGLMLPDPVILPSKAEVYWVNRESRSLAERADAAVKLGSAGMPWQFIGEYVFDLTQEEINRIEAMRASDVLSDFLGNRPPPPGDTPPA